MRSDHLIAALLAAFAVAAPATAAKTERLDVSTLAASGEVRRCISNRNNVSTRPAGESALMFRTGANSWFRNDLRSSCPSLRDDRTLVFRSSSSQYCEMDLFSVVDTLSRINFGTCSPGKFTPVEVPKGARF